jgi:hypothetical protein
VDARGYKCWRSDGSETEISSRFAPFGLMNPYYEVGLSINRLNLDVRRYFIQIAIDKQNALHSTQGAVTRYFIRRVRIYVK